MLGGWHLFTMREITDDVATLEQDAEVTRHLARMIRSQAAIRTQTGPNPNHGSVAEKVDPSLPSPECIRHATHVDGENPEKSPKEIEA